MQFSQELLNFGYWYHNITTKIWHTLVWRAELPHPVCSWHWHTAHYLLSQNTNYTDLFNPNYSLFWLLQLLLICLPCHGPGGCSLASHCGRKCSLPGQSMWNLWWTKCPATSFSPNTAICLCQFSFHQCSILIPHHLWPVQCAPLQLQEQGTQSHPTPPHKQ